MKRLGRDGHNRKTLMIVPARTGDDAKAHGMVSRVSAVMF